MLTDESYGKIYLKKSNINNDNYIDYITVITSNIIITYSRAVYHNYSYSVLITIFVSLFDISTRSLETKRANNFAIFTFLHALSIVLRILLFPCFFFPLNISFLCRIFLQIYQPYNTKRVFATSR